LVFFFSFFSDAKRKQKKKQKEKEKRKGKMNIGQACFGVLSEFGLVGSPNSSLRFFSGFSLSRPFFPQGKKYIKGWSGGVVKSNKHA